MNVKNIDSHDIEVPYEGVTYKFIQGITVKVPEIVGAHLEENFPLSFNFGAQLQKEEAPEAETFKTKIYTSESIYNSSLDMKVTSPKPQSTFTPDETPANGQKESDGIEYYGEGVEVDQAN